jgi:hypothetical protein
MTLPNEDLIENIPDMLKCCASIEALREILGDNIEPMPEGISNTKSLTYALSDIPQEYLEVIIDAVPNGGRQRDTRIRPVRPRKRPANTVQRNLRFADSAKIERIRRDFIAVCMCIAMESAIIYHKFLL